jgi:rfaE bifunctional protein nucleotidyltransferase chain/domain
LLKNNFEVFYSKTKDKKIVFTNGCFDILHRGHLTYLNDAKKLGELLVVGINSDESVRKLKGPLRPVNNEDDRKFALENLKSVDYVFVFDEETPLSLIEKINPSVLVKGGDWSVDKIVGADFVLKNGGKVLSLPFIDGFSTTSFIESLQGKK